MWYSCRMVKTIDCMVEKGVITEAEGDRLKEIIMVLPTTEAGLLTIIAAILIDANTGPTP